MRTQQSELSWAHRLPAMMAGKNEVQARFEYIPLFASLTPLAAADLLCAIFVRAEAIHKAEKQGSWQSPGVTEWAKRGEGAVSGRWKGNTRGEDRERASRS